MVLNIAKDFSTKPGLRFRTQTDFSGEQFREDKLLPAFQVALKDGKKLTVVLDGTEGFTPSFLEEAFGGLARIEGIGIQKVKDNLVLVSNEATYLIADIERYVNQALNKVND